MDDEDKEDEDKDLGTAGLESAWFATGTGQLPDSLTLSRRGWAVLVVTVFVLALVIALVRGDTQAASTCVALAIVTALGYVVVRVARR